MFFYRPKISNVQNEGAFSIVLNILQHEKLSGLWRGMTPVNNIFIL